MKSLSKRKTKQLRVFFRFLKDLGMFEQYRNIFFNKAKALPSKATGLVVAISNLSDPSASGYKI